MVMRVLRVGFVGTRTPQVAETTAFFRDLLGLPVVRDDPTWSILQLPTGSFDFLELYGPEFDDTRLAPPGQSMFVAFMVEDVRSAHAEAAAAGANPSDIVWANEAFD